MNLAFIFDNFSGLSDLLEVKVLRRTSACASCISTGLINDDAYRATNIGARDKCIWMLILIFLIK
jgi:hypothetical protein